MNIALVVTIGLLLFFIAYLQWRHERWVAQVVARLPPPTPAPAPLPPPLMYADLFPEEPFELERRTWGVFDEVAPTRLVRPSIHPPFQSYGVDVSYHPIVGVS